MFVVFLMLILVCSLLLTLFSYLTRLSSERGHFLIRGSKDNVEIYEEEIEPKLGITMEHAAWAFPLLVQVSVLLLGLTLAAWNLGRPFAWVTLLQEAALLLLDVLVFGLVIPNILLTRTSGKWLHSWIGALRISVRIAYPLVSICQFLHHVSTLGGRSEEEEKSTSQSENIEALMQAGEEEGLLEKEDRKLIQSVVEFGDTTVREVMTPRQQMVAVPVQTTLNQLRQTLATKRFTRIPVYEGDIDHVVGFVHAGDLFAVGESDLERRTVQELLRPVSFVPETKRISELLDELKQSAQIAIVVDEYGSVAGLATVEDLVEEIVGDIRDEHEMMDIHPLGEGQYSMSGGIHLDRLQELFDVRLDDSGEASTVSGLVTDTLGRVPAAGERIERDGLVFQISESNGRRVIRLVVTGPPPKSSEASETKTQIPAMNPGATDKEID
ncbi:MAG: HlyC/CorC family transporter [Acidobacteria bacterium]|nr:HlyC/CorC family transporter [Acidobacteriota bacterium]